MLPCGFSKPSVLCPIGSHTFWAISRRHHTVTFGLTLLHGGWPQGLSALSRWLASVAGAAHRALLLAEATLCGTLKTGVTKSSLYDPLSSPLSQRAEPTYLTPLTGHPAGGRAAAQVTSHSRWWLGCRRAVPRGQSRSLICTLTEDHSVAETRPTAWGTLQLEGVFYIQWMVRVLGLWDTRSGQVGPMLSSSPVSATLSPTKYHLPQVCTLSYAKGQTKPRVQKPWDP